MTSALFLGLDTYSRPGGIQRFNQRIVAGLAGLAEDAGAPRPVVHLMRDGSEDLPSHVSAHIKGFGPDRASFIRSSLRAARNAQLLLIGQMNLLPVAALAKAANPRLKIVLFVHGIEVWNDSAYRRKRFYEPLLLRCIDVIASVSQHTARIMQREFGASADKFVIFPNAIDGPVCERAEPSTERRILAVTRMAAHDHGKNLDQLLRAFALIQPCGLSATLEIIGDGVLRPELEVLTASLGVTEEVQFLGRVSDEELDAAYRRASIFALPSSKEGFGIVYLEAWKHALPVICSTEGASHEIVSHGQDGFVVDPRDPIRISQHLKLLLNDPVRAQSMGNAGARKVATRYLDASFRENLRNLIDAQVPYRAPTMGAPG